MTYVSSIVVITYVSSIVVMVSMLSKESVGGCPTRVSIMSSQRLLGKRVPQCKSNSVVSVDSGHVGSVEQY
jgi:hypothetical protein